MTATSPAPTVETVDVDGTTFTRVDPSAGTYFGDLYRLRAEASRDLDTAEAGRLAGLVGYAWAAEVRGERLAGTENHDTARSVTFYADLTKSRSDDASHAMSAFAATLDVLVATGTPVRKTDRSGPGTKGTRLVAAVHDPGTEPVTVTLWADHVYRFHAV